MKKYFKVLLAFAAVVLASAMVMLSACATSVAGKVYKFSDVEFTTAEEVSDLEQSAIDFAVELAKESFKGLTFSFAEDGKVSVKVGEEEVSTGVTYTQDGATVTFVGLSDVEIGSTAEAKGNTLSFVYEDDSLASTLNFDVTIKIIFERQ